MPLKVNEKESQIAACFLLLIGKGQSGLLQGVLIKGLQTVIFALS
jgi:hypothetical protein